MVLCACVLGIGRGRGNHNVTHSLILPGLNAGSCKRSHDYAQSCCKSVGGDVREAHWWIVVGSLTKESGWGVGMGQGEQISGGWNEAMTGWGKGKGSG